MKLGVQTVNKSFYSELSKEWIKKLLNLYPEYTKVYGIFQGKDHRLRITLHNPETKIPGKYMSYPKALMEVHLGRRLKTKEDGVDEEETVDHIDRDFLNNDISNLRVVKKSIHNKYDALRRELPLANCLVCNKEFQVTEGQINSRSLCRPGPFCSYKCRGIHNQKAAFSDKIANYDRLREPTYYQLNKNYTLEEHFNDVWYDSNCAKCGKVLKTKIINTPIYCSQNCIGIYNGRYLIPKPNKIFFHEVSYEELIMYLSGLLPE